MILYSSTKRTVHTRETCAPFESLLLEYTCAIYLLLLPLPVYQSDSYRLLRKFGPFCNITPSLKEAFSQGGRLLPQAAHGGQTCYPMHGSSKIQSS